MAAMRDRESSQGKKVKCLELHLQERVHKSEEKSEALIALIYSRGHNVGAMNDYFERQTSKWWVNFQY